MNIKVCDGYDRTKEMQNYNLDVDDDFIVSSITCKNIPEYWYATIDGKLFKTDPSMRSGLKGIFFSKKEDLEKALADGLYWRKNIIPHIGANVGYDEQDFYKELKKHHKVEIHKVNF